MKKSLLCLLALTFVFGCCGCENRLSALPEEVSSSSEAVSVIEENSELTEETPEEPEDIITEAILLAVGDNLIHDVIYYQAARRTDDGSYDFLPVYENIREQIAAADLAYINQETQMAESMEPSSYPMFNTPTEMAANLSELGFDIINLANNHMLDKGVKGLCETIDLLHKTEGISAVTGAYDHQEKYGDPVVIEKNDIKFGFVGFTQHTNGLPLPKDNANMIIYTDNTDEMHRQIQELKEVSDVVIVSVHWGDEGLNQPNKYQRELAQQFADWGVDIVIGTHPHVLQPIEYVTGENGSETLVFYSLGNFVSAQIDPANLIGGIAQITATKNHTTGKVSVSVPKMNFVITQYGSGFRDLHLVALENYTDELASQHGVVLKYGRKFDLEYIRDFIGETIDSRFLS